MSAKKVIWKFPLYGRFNNLLMMPKDAQILTIQIQNNQPTIWAMVDIQNNLNGLESHLTGIKYSAHEEREFETIFTGETMDKLPEGKERVYINTVQNNNLVYHFFEIKNINENN